VDPVTTLVNLMGQRRRWINGTWFALEYVLQNSYLVYQSSHDTWERFWFNLSMYYAILMKMLTFYIIGLYFVVLYMMVEDMFKELAMGSLDGRINELASISAAFVFIYILLVGIMIYVSLHFGNRDAKAQPKFYAIATSMGIFVTISFVLVFYNIFRMIIFKDTDATVIKTN
jgi:chitin synthase